MSNLDQIKLDESIRELTLDEQRAVSGGGDGDDLGDDFDGVASAGLPPVQPWPLTRDDTCNSMDAGPVLR
jgi:hypothetical protein